MLTAHLRTSGEIQVPELLNRHPEKIRPAISGLRNPLILPELSFVPGFRISGSSETDDRVKTKTSELRQKLQYILYHVLNIMLYYL